MVKFHDSYAVYKNHQSVPLFVVSHLLSGVIGNVLYKVLLILLSLISVLVIPLYAKDSIHI